MNTPALLKSIKDSSKIARNEAQSILLYVRNGDFEQAELHLNKLNELIDKIHESVLVLERLIITRVHGVGLRCDERRICTITGVMIITY